MSFIKDFWEEQGKTHRESHAASWKDIHAINLEIDNIKRFIKGGDVVIDVGCANGYSTFRQFEINGDAKYVGIDYAEAMIESAKTAQSNRSIPDSSVTFKVASVLDLPFDDATFDVAYTTRVLINLPSWDEQKKGIVEALRVVRPGGVLVISEGFWEPLCKLNSLRLMFGLEPLVEHDFNRYLKKTRLEEWLKSADLDFENEDFSSLYYLGSRLIRETVKEENTPWGDYSSGINQFFYDLEQKYTGIGVGVQQSYAIRKP